LSNSVFPRATFVKKKVAVTLFFFRISSRREV
jgi:hypothetical protein